MCAGVGFVVTRFYLISGDFAFFQRGHPRQVHGPEQVALERRDGQRPVAFSHALRTGRVDHRQRVGHGRRHLQVSRGLSDVAHAQFQAKPDGHR